MPPWQNYAYLNAEVAKPADAQGLGPCGSKIPWEFKSPPQHNRFCAHKKISTGLENRRALNYAVPHTKPMQEISPTEQPSPANQEMNADENESEKIRAINAYLDYLQRLMERAEEETARAISEELILESDGERLNDFLNNIEREINAVDEKSGTKDEILAKLKAIGERLKLPENIEEKIENSIQKQKKNRELAVKKFEEWIARNAGNVEQAQAANKVRTGNSGKVNKTNGERDGHGKKKSRFGGLFGIGRRGRNNPANRPLAE